MIGLPRILPLGLSWWGLGMGIVGKGRWVFKLLDLFSGIGGFSLGLERSGGFETVAFCEIEPFPRRVLAKHWPKVPIYDDIRTLTAARLATDGIAVDAICGGFPCQDISNAGLRAGIEGERSGLWSEYARLIGELRPRYVFVENVAALLGRGMGRVLGDLSALGYDAEWRIISAADVGAPHKRERVWIVAHPQEGMHDGIPILSSVSIAEHEEEFKCVRSDISSLSMGGKPPSDFRNLRKDDGIYGRLAEIMHYGNAVVPQIPEILGRAVMDYEATIPLTDDPSPAQKDKYVAFS